MDSKQKRRKKKLKQLGKGRIKGVGIFARFRLKSQARSDAKKHIPRIENGEWTSPLIHREMLGYEEHEAYLWGTLQDEFQAAFARLRELTDLIDAAAADADKAKAELAAAENAEPPVKVRGRGEEKLPDEIITARRTHERDQRLSPLKSRVKDAEKILSDYKTEFSQLHSDVTEQGNLTKFLSEKALDNTLKRIDIYWEQVLTVSAERASMPAVLSLKPDRSAEQLYYMAHKEILEKAKSISENNGITLNEHKKEVA